MIFSSAMGHTICSHTIAPARKSINFARELCAGCSGRGAARRDRPAWGMRNRGTCNSTPTLLAGASGALGTARQTGARYLLPRVFQCVCHYRCSLSVARPPPPLSDGLACTLTQQTLTH
jgi:hypothetical protein